jgi:hypothetical protein
MNPYSAIPNAELLAERQDFRWRRIALWSVAIMLAANVVGFLSGLSMVRWDLYGTTMEEAVANARLARRVAAGMVVALLYWRMVAPVTARRWLSRGSCVRSGPSAGHRYVCSDLSCFVLRTDQPWCFGSERAGGAGWLGACRFGVEKFFQTGAASRCCLTHVSGTSLGRSLQLASGRCLG